MQSIRETHPDLFPPLDGSPTVQLQRKIARNNPNAVAYRARLCSWILRIYTGAGGLPRFAQRGSPAQAMIADLLGIEALGLAATNEAKVRSLLEQAHAAHITTYGEAVAPAEECHLQRCLQWLCTCANLTPTETAVLELVVCGQFFAPMRRALSLWDELNHGGLVHAMSMLLDEPAAQVDAAISNRGRLVRCGLLEVSAHGGDVLHRMLSVPSYLGKTLAHYQGAPQNLLQGFMQPLQHAGGSLEMASFSHVQRHTDLANSWLSAALAAGSGTGGVNAPDTEHREHRCGHLLVSGAPGLGKTQWVRAWLQHYCAHVDPTLQAWELQVLDEEGHALTGQERLRQLQMAMGLVSHMVSAAPAQTPASTSNRSHPKDSPRHSVLVFDEADDAFHEAMDAGGNNRGAASMANHRASLNRLIEESQVPVVWIMNHPQVLDPAVLRRFDAVVHFEAVARSVRKRLLQERLGSHVAQAELDRWADITDLTPALIDRLSTVWTRSHAASAGEATSGSMAMTVEGARHWLRERLPGKVTRHLRLAPARVKPPADGSSVDASAILDASRWAWTAEQVHASVNLEELATSLGAMHTGTGGAGSAGIAGNAGATGIGARLLLWGPPGTGKTAYARHLARRLDKPLLELRASDLLSPFVGGTEQQIARAFETALTDDALVFLDEVDSLLYSRSGAMRSWEVSQVNELLEHLGEFEGWVVLATNRMDALDPAVLRRMDFKVKFDYLQTAQLLQGFASLCERLQVPNALTVDEQQSLASIRQATAGDLACVARRAALMPARLRQPDSTPARELVAMLLEEIHTKSGGRSPMGFLSLQSRGVSEPAVDLTKVVWIDDPEEPAT